MARPRTNLPWIEIRGTQARARWRLQDGRRTYLAFPSEREARDFRELAGLVGLDHAVQFVTGAIPPDAAAVEAAATTGSDARAAPAVDPAGSEQDRGPARPGEPVGVGFADLTAAYFDNLTGQDPKTRAGYRAIVDHYLVPYFGNQDIGLVLSKEPIRPPAHPCLTITGWVTWMAGQHTYTNKGRRTAKLVSPKTTRNAHGVLFAIFGAALDDPLGGLLLRNPCQATRLPEDVETERVFLEWRQVRYLLDAMPAHWRPLVLFLALTGVRYGEAAGLTVGHLHLDPELGPAYVDVVRAMRWQGGRRVLGRLKSRTSRRRLYLPHGLLGALRPLIAGKAAEDLVFTTPTGAPLHHSNFTDRVLIPALVAARRVDATIPTKTRVHAFRHTHAALLASAGHSTRVIKERLGHANITTTDRIYGHLTQDATVATIATLDALMRRAVVDPRAELQAVNAESADLPDAAGAGLPEVDFDDAEEFAA